MTTSERGSFIYSFYNFGYFSLSVRLSLQPASCDAYDPIAEVNSDLIELSDSQRTALALYHNTFSDERVDHDLIVHVIKKVQETEEDRGAVLVFLPGYEDIVTLR